MKQRLGIAYALLGNPELVFLDEPTNGLDPAGMVEVRELIGRLGEAGHTVVLSSHLMNEVEQLCDHVAILSRGVLLAQGRVRDLLNRQDSVRLKTTDDVRAGKILQALDWVASLRVEAGYLVLDCPAQRSGELTRELSRNEIFVTEMMPRRQSLESYFLEVTGSEAAQVQAMMQASSTSSRWKGSSSGIGACLGFCSRLHRLHAAGSMGRLSFLKTAVNAVQVPREVMRAMPGMRRGFRCDELCTRPAEVLPGLPPRRSRSCWIYASATLDPLQPDDAHWQCHAALGVAGTIGMVLLGILSASAFGAEYGLGIAAHPRAWCRQVAVRRRQIPDPRSRRYGRAGAGRRGRRTSGLLISKLAIPPPNMPAA
jgi:hypothetical protein